MHDDSVLNRIGRDACGASRPAAVNEDATAEAVARHTDHFLSRLQSSMSIDERLRREDEANYEARCDEEDARREERERRQWEEDTGRVRP